MQLKQNLFYIAMVCVIDWKINLYLLIKIICYYTFLEQDLIH